MVALWKHSFHNNGKTKLLKSPTMFSENRIEVGKCLASSVGAIIYCYIFKMKKLKRKCTEN